MYGIQKKKMPIDFFWIIMKMAFTKNIPNMSQGPPNPGFRYIPHFRKLRFSQKGLERFQKKNFNLGSCEFLARLKSKIRKCLFFDSTLL